MIYSQLKIFFSKKWMHYASVFFLCTGGLFVTPETFSQSVLPESKTRLWLKEVSDFSLNKIIENISPSDASPGVVIASRSTSNPNYYYHWVRDAGLTVEALIELYQSTDSDWKHEVMSRKIFEYLEFSTLIQKVKTLSDLGEPKFNVDGSAFNGPWARPQNDSPALRAISLIHWANILIDEGKEPIVRQKMYTATLPATAPIKMDLEYISYHWKDPSYDLWEEVKGTHFYTLMVERRALLEGAVLARKLGDKGAANWYVKQGKEIEVELQKFYDAKARLYCGYVK